MFSGSFGILWSITWFCIAVDSPSLDRNITHKERKYIEDSLKDDNVSVKVFPSISSLFFQFLTSTISPSMGSYYFEYYYKVILTTLKINGLEDNVSFSSVFIKHKRDDVTSNFWPENRNDVCYKSISLILITRQHYTGNINNQAISVPSVWNYQT